MNHANLFFVVVVSCCTTMQ